MANVEPIPGGAFPGNSIRRIDPRHDRGGEEHSSDFDAELEEQTQKKPPTDEPKAVRHEDQDVGHPEQGEAGSTLDLTG